MADKGWKDIQVSQRLYDEITDRITQGARLPKVKKENTKKDVPYLEVIVTGNPSKKRFENLERVKFPAFCIYGWNKEYVGVINMAFLGTESGDPTYELHDITQQHNGINRQSGFSSLKEMHELYNIREIVKAKIIIKRGQ